MSGRKQTERDKRQAIIAKVRALMAKTVDNGATEAEAKAAAEKVDELVAAYAIQLSETGSREPVDRFIDENERREITGFSRQHWFRLENRGLVPRRVKIGEWKVAWRLSEIIQWIEARTAKRDAASAAGGFDARSA